MNTANVEVKRDGIILRGQVNKPEFEGKKPDTYPALILFHGFTGDLGYDSDSIYYKIAEQCTQNGICVYRFDFDGHGKSDGAFSDMDVLREILDAIEILKYVQDQPNVSEIYVLGHSQGGVIGGILAGLYPDVIKKLVLLAPAATLKTDAIKGTCMGITYDTKQVPRTVQLNDIHSVGGHYFRIAKHLPIYEITGQFDGPALVIHGVEDDVVSYHASEEYNRCMANSTLKLFDKLDHGIGGEAQNQVLKDIREFL